MFIEERHQEILKLIEENGRVTIGQIQSQFNVSLDSARRDLRILEEKGLLKRTHGGAISAVEVGVHPPLNSTPRDIGSSNEFYSSIAKKAADYIKENDTIYIPSASFGYLMTKYFPNDISFTVVTNSIVIADELKLRDNITTFVIGGKLRNNGSFVDAIAVEVLKFMRFDTVFLTGSGFSADFGMSNTSHETAFYQRTVIERSKQKIALFPHSKIGFEAFAKVIDVNKFDILITDWEALEEELVKIQDLGVEIIITEQN